jgi:hypothetical protein
MGPRDNKLRRLEVSISLWGDPELELLGIWWICYVSLVNRGIDH